jgi:hypothetical protein
MQKNLTLKLLPSEAANELLIKKIISGSEGVPLTSVNGFYLLKRSIDARGKTALGQYFSKSFY